MNYKYLLQEKKMVNLLSCKLVISNKLVAFLTISLTLSITLFLNTVILAQGISWSTPQTIVGSVPLHQGTSGITVDANGVWHVVYDWNSNPPTIDRVTYANGLGDNTDLVSDNVRGSSDIAVGSNGKLHVIYRSDGGSIKYLNNVSGSWSTPQTIVGSVPLHQGTSGITVDANGVWHVVYDWNSNPPTIDRVTYANGLGDNTDLASDNVRGSSDIAVDSNGKLHVIYRSDGGSIKYLNNVSGSWSTPQTIVGSVPLHQGTSGITVDANGVWHVVYDWNTDPPTDFRLAYANSLGSSLDLLVDNITGSSDIAVDSIGRLHAIYRSIGGSIRYIFGEPEYKLKRISNGNLEYFDPNTHAWQFGNSDTYANGQPIMWPQSWWSQFNYYVGTDPYTQDFYPNFFLFTTFPQLSNFPDWPLFVDAFGINQCYLGIIPNQHNYSLQAMLKWKSIKRSWGGSCFGFAITCFQAFDDLNAPNLHSLPFSDDNRLNINKFFIYQFGKVQLAHINASFHSKTPKQTLNEIKQMLFTNVRDDKILALIFDVIINNQVHTVGHAVNPYRIERDQNNPDLEHIYVYDNNDPTYNNSPITINTANNTWAYSEWGISGLTKGLFLMDPISDYNNPPILSNQSPNNVISSNSQNLDQFVEIFTPASSNTIITNSEGLIIGNIDSAAFNNFVDGIPIIPMTGTFQPPIGYYLLADHYTIQIENFSDSLSYFSVFTDSVIYDYSRNDADSLQTDYLNYANGQLALENLDNLIKEFNIKAVAIEDTCERFFEVKNCNLFHTDSLNFDVINQKDLRFVNVGVTKSYDLSIRLVTENQEDIFEHINIELNSTTTHQIVPDWDNLGVHPVQILVDSGNTGSFEDTLYITNQYTGINEDNKSSNLPKNYFVSQNFPNPFNSTTIISFGIPKSSHVKISIFNIRGQKVTTLLDSKYPAGHHTVKFDANHLASGLYFYCIQTDQFTKVMKMLLLK